MGGMKQSTTGGFMKEIYRREKYPDGRVLTRCFLLNGERPVAYGQALKRPEDNYDRKLGNLIARNRAYKAFAERKRVDCQRTASPRYAVILRAYEDYDLLNHIRVKT